jgi:hypothetical protein
MMFNFILVWLMYMAITFVLVKFFHYVEYFTMEQTSMIKFHIKLKKPATETFEMLISAYS